MPFKTDLNVTPYYDDYDSSDNFQQVLARPGHAVQARELTQMQSILKNQIEKLGDFVLKEGTVVIPGQAKIIKHWNYLKLDNAYGGETIDVTQYKDKTITGTTSGITAVVVDTAAATTSDQATLFVRYSKVGTDNTSTTFTAGETLSASAGVTHGSTSYSTNAVSAQVYSTSPTGKGLAVQMTAGVYYIRGCFVEVEDENLVLSKYENVDVNYRVGFTITETVVTPENDSTLLDNATGTSNYAAKGAHRLKVSAKLAKLAPDSTADSNFLELFEIRNGQSTSVMNRTELGSIVETLARRTYDESGDYTVRPFTFEVKESVTLNENVGVYAAGAATNDGGTASTSLLSLKVSPGKAYIRGFEIEKTANTYKDIPKARDFNTINAAVTSYDVGNFLNISNVYGTPDISFVSGESTAYKQISLFDTATATRGSSSGTRIGLARARSIEYSSGTAGETSAVYKLYLWDFRPFTTITLSGTPSPTLEASHSNGGVQVKGATSGAKGWVFADGTSGATVVLTNVMGNFTDGEKITSTAEATPDLIVEDSGNADLTITRTITNNISESRQVHMLDDDSGQNFTADIILDPVTTTESFVLLDGTDSKSANSEDHVVSELDKVPIGLQRGATGNTGSSLGQSQLKFADKNTGLFKLPKSFIKTLLTTKNAGVSDTQYTVRRQFVTTSSSVGVITLSAGTNETFVSHAEKDYTISILTAGGNGTGVQGDIVSASTGFAGGGTATLTITNLAVFGNGAKVKITATLLKTAAITKTKTVNLMKQLTVSPGATDAYGTRPTDKTISLGRADAFKLVGVFDSEATGTAATAPSLTLGTITGTFTRGEKITGSSSGASARIIGTSSPMSYVLARGTSTDFTTSDTITGASSGATSAVSAVTEGSPDITNRFELDTGQRDNYYDISRIVRKEGVSKPLGKLLVVYDYMEHGTGDFFSVDSYSDVADQMTYEDIPTYSAMKLDPDDFKLDGAFNLHDCIDIRPRAEDIAGTSTDVNSVDEVTGNSFDFYHRQFDGTGSSTVDFLQPGSAIQCDLEYYLPYLGVVQLEKSGNFTFSRGESSETPKPPKIKNNAMLMAEIGVPAYTKRPSDVVVTREKNRRYTMKDIGKIEQRLQHVEYYTALNMLERDAESFEITDANGLNRFKSGFVVDDFSGHRVGDARHKDYKVSIDMQKNELRPINVPKGVSLIESVSTDTARATAGYQKTGDLLTLPYEEVTFQEQSYATRIERVNPVLMSSWVGKIDLSPSGDEWFEQEAAPDLIINVDGNFDTFYEANKEAIGTVWNAWQTTWTGVVDTSTSVQGTGPTNAGAIWMGQNDQPGWVDRTIRTIRTDQTRTGIQTNVVPQIDLESQGTQVIQTAFIPFCRARNVSFTGTGFYPNMRLYAFFDKKDVKAYVTPLSGYTTDTTIVAASPMITTAAGEIKGTFQIPDPKIDGNPKFRTGEVEFRLTSSDTDSRIKSPQTAGTTIYNAVGILETEQETIIATRNAKIEQTDVSQDTSVMSQETHDRPRPWMADGENWEPDGGGDPLAQTFMVSGDVENVAAAGGIAGSGRFITSLDLFFQARDDNLPLWVEIRNASNGYPGPKILPFGRVTKSPSEINISDDASTATKFTFPSPVFLQNDVEYCFVVLCNTPEYTAWIARMGEEEIGGSRSISEQPHIGTLFKGHNNRSWAPSMTEDIKFVMRAAKFTTTDGTVTLNNDAVPTKTLPTNPLVFTNGNTALLVNHRNHHMYATTNNVTLSDVKSGASTTLAAALDSSATSLTLTSGTDFDDTTGKFAYDTSSQWWIKIDDEVMKYTAISSEAVSSVTRAQDSTTAVAHASGATVELYMLHKVPFTEINKTHTALANIGKDSYTVVLTSSPTISGGTDTADAGGTIVKATENACYDTGMPTISTMEVPETGVTAKIRPMTATSPSGSQTSFAVTTTSDAISIPLNDNVDYDVPNMIASTINETNENGGNKSFIMDLTLSSNNADISPVIDSERMTFIAVANRLDNIDSSSDVYPTVNFTSSTDPDGDNNAAIYMTKKVTLENSATAIKVFFAAHRHSTSEIKVYHKILRTDDASDFDDLGWVAFNTTGVPDNTTSPSLEKHEFKQYVYTAGITDDGVGTPLDEFISFAIKIVMQGTNTAEPPRIKELRCIALAL